MREDKYWCTFEGDEFLDALNSKIQTYYDFLQTSNIHDIWNLSFIAYYGGDLNNQSNIFESAKLQRGGKLGQITKVKINHYRNLVKHAVNLATANKSSLSCVAANTDSKSQSQTVLGSALLDYYMTVRKVGFNTRKAVEYSCLTGEGWIHAPWSPKEGNIYDVDESGKPSFEGDLKVSHHSGYDVIRDVTLRSNVNDWLTLREFQNKWNLLAQYPDFEDEILSETSYDYEATESFRFEITNGIDDENSENIPVYTFYHKETPAMPEGRLVICTRNVIFFDGALPYSDVPLRHVMPDVLHESPFGYSPFNDLLGLQQATDNLASTLLSNNMTFGKQHLWKQRGDNLDVKNLEGGLKLLQSETKPEPLQLTRSAPETYTLLDKFESAMETLSGISSTVRGNPQASLKSGSALALVVAQSIQFGSDLEQSYNDLVTDVGMLIIEHLQDFAKTPRLALIAGEANRPYMAEFVSDDIADIKRVTVQQVNALSKTISGRLEIAQQVMNMPPEQARTYMAILNTGQLPADFQTHSAVMNVKAENEALRKGDTVQAILTENHITHIKEHMAVIENPEAKKDAELVDIVLNHVQDHLNLWRTMDPGLMAVLGMQPPPPDNNPMSIAQQNNLQGQEAPVADIPQMMKPQAVEGTEQARGPSMPNLPGNVDPQTAGNYEGFLDNQ